MTTEALDPIPLSALQHWAYCPRQCALIHVEQLFEDTMSGSTAASVLLISTHRLSCEFARTPSERDLPAGSRASYPTE